MLFVLGNVSTYFSKQWDTFIVQFGFFTTLSSVTGVVLYFILRKKIEYRFQHKIESLKLDHQKVMFNFETFSNQQNQRYPQMYSLVEHALGGITGLRGYRTSTDLKKFTIQGVKAYCEKIEMDADEIDRIISLWERDKEHAISEIKSLKNFIDYYRAEVKWRDANNYLIENELYFSDEVTNQTRGLLELMGTYLANLNPEWRDPMYYDDLVQMNKENKVLKQQIEEQREIWKTTLKKELSGQRLSG